MTTAMLAPAQAYATPSLRNTRSYYVLEALNSGTCRSCKRPLTIRETIDCKCGFRVGPEELAAYREIQANLSRSRTASSHA